MKYGKAQVQFGVFFTSAVEGKKWPPSRSGCIIPVEVARLGTLAVSTAEI
jgi:hypothetical protein